MKKMWIRNRKGKLHFRSKMLFGVLVLAIIVGLGAGPYTARGQGRAEQASGQIGLFDPFALTTIYVDAPQGLSVAGALQGAPASDGMAMGSPVLIPYRPPIRSPFRPPWTPGPPSGEPGPPPWSPGPPWGR